MEVSVKVVGKNSATKQEMVNLFLGQEIMTLKLKRFTSDVRKKFFTIRMVMHRNGLPREVVCAIRCKYFQGRLDGSLSNVVSWKMSLPVAGDLELDDI